MDNYVPVLVLLVFVAGVAAASLLLSLAFGQKGKETRAKNEPYECGLKPQGPSRLRFSVKFYVVAMLFILFDVEVVFLYPWAAIYDEAIQAGKGPFLFLEVVAFVAVLFLGWVYALRKGALEWRS